MYNPIEKLEITGIYVEYLIAHFPIQNVRRLIL